MEQASDNQGNVNAMRSAIALCKSGEKTAGRTILLRLLKQDPTNEMAWMWLVETLDGDEARLEALRHCLKYIPESERAQKAIHFLEKRTSPAPSMDFAETGKPLKTKKSRLNTILIVLLILIILGGLAAVYFFYLQPMGIINQWLG